MFPDLNGQLGARLIIATIVVALALFLFFLVSRSWRNRGTRAFLRGGSNRQPRLAVLDAAAVDAKRRLVLVRRDEIEHLLLIGGPTDVIVESRIGAELAAAAHVEPIRAAVSQEPAATRAEAAAEKQEQPHPIQPAAAAATAEKADSSMPPPIAAPVARVPAAATAPAPPPSTEAPSARVLAQAEAAADRTPPAAEMKPEPAEPVALPQEAKSAPKAPDPSPVARQMPAVDVASLLDDERERVFGSPAPKQDSPYIRAYTDDASPEQPAQPAPAALPKAAFSASILRFDDFLDAEIAGDLSKVTPAEPDKSAEKPKPVPSLRDARAAAPARRDDALDDEMARLLGELSPKR
ncbi:MAG TPA: hypothetical protein VFJ18_01150 [Pararhizobium sp.]|nr:hypothetical protein [Pararhizobium sp.]